MEGKSKGMEGKKEEQRYKEGQEDVREAVGKDEGCEE